MSRTATLVFDEYPDDEIIVRLAPIPMREYLEVLGDFDAIRTGATGGTDATLAFFRKFAALALASWTFPEPADAEGMMSRDFNLAMAIVGQWVMGVRDVPLPLPLTPSAGIEPTPEASQPPSPEPN